VKTVSVILLLASNFIKGALLSGLDTARVILHKPTNTRAGLARLSYPELSPAYASLLGTMVTLTPGTTLVDIDTTRHELVLHLLDLEQRDATLQSIRRDFAEPLAMLSGGK
jgi:multicomponent K+:H+ antiporter subunit E/multicomponent Na+:H+ antiporter subunit E